jgi:hypothetical protein
VLTTGVAGPRPGVHSGWRVTLCGPKWALHDLPATRHLPVDRLQPVCAWRWRRDAVPSGARSPGNRWHDHHGHRRDLLDSIVRACPRRAPEQPSAPNNHRAGQLTDARQTEPTHPRATHRKGLVMCTSLLPGRDWASHGRPCPDPSVPGSARAPLRGGFASLDDQATTPWDSGACKKDGAH